MSKQQNREVDADLRDVPPIGYFLIGTLFGWAFLSTRPLQRTYPLADFAVAGGSIILSLYIVYRAYQIYESRGIASTLDWLITPVEELGESNQDESISEKEDSPEIVMPNLTDADPYEFEEIVAELFRRKGYDAEATNKSGDYGIDVIAERNGTKTGIQVKKYADSNLVTAPEIRKTIGAKDRAGVDKMIFLTTSWYTDPAEEQARDSPIELWDQQDFKEQYDKYMRGGG